MPHPNHMVVRESEPVKRHPYDSEPVKQNLTAQFPQLSVTVTLIVLVRQLRKFLSYSNLSPIQKQLYFIVERANLVQRIRNQKSLVFCVFWS